MHTDGGFSSVYLSNNEKKKMLSIILLASANVFSPLSLPPPHPDSPTHSPSDHSSRCRLWPCWWVPKTSAGFDVWCLLLVWVCLAQPGVLKVIRGMRYECVCVCVQGQAGSIKLKSLSFLLAICRFAEVWQWNEFTVVAVLFFFLFLTHVYCYFEKTLAGAQLRGVHLKRVCQSGLATECNHIKRANKKEKMHLFMIGSKNQWTYSVFFLFFLSVSNFRFFVKSHIRDL